ncbi:MAG: methylated-DNA--[protein]-cysteine S-methyltransferase [Deltaproteobacteria bacterium]|nr:methylated-DNA--[protein]-cysteine S-methyltransferase [Deltaproteobacteria bacterium]
MGVVRSAAGIKKVLLPQDDPKDVTRRIKNEFPDASANEPLLRWPATALAAYFEGKEIVSPLPIDLSSFSDFSQAVWRATQSISYGTVRPYSWVGKCMKKAGAARAVGNALRRNPFPLIVPCHRVIHKDGSLGGFSGLTGTAVKRKLLELEGVCFDRKGRALFLR